MTPQEKELLTTLLDRVKNAPRQDKDPEADALIRQAMAAQPDLPYYLVQMHFRYRYPLNVIFLLLSCTAVYCARELFIKGSHRTTVEHA